MAALLVDIISQKRKLELWQVHYLCSEVTELINGSI